MDSNNSEISLKELILIFKSYVVYLLSKWWLLLLFIVIGAFAGYFYAKAKTTYYEGTTTFVLEGSGSSTTSSASGVASMLGINLGSMDGSGNLFQGESLFELYKSRFVLEKVLLKQIQPDSEELLVQRFFASNEQLKEVLEQRPELKELVKRRDFFLNPSPQEIRKRDSILNGVSNTIKNEFLEIQKINPKANIIAVKVRSEDEEFAKVFNEKIVEDVNEYYINVKTGRAKDNVDLLQYKVDSVASMLDRAVSTVGSIEDKTPNINPTRQSQRNIPLQRSMISSEMNKAILGELNRNLELSKISLAKDAPLIKVVDAVRYPLQKTAPNIKLYAVVGGILFCFLITSLLVFRRVIRNIMNS